MTCARSSIAAICHPAGTQSPARAPALGVLAGWMGFGAMLYGTSFGAWRGGWQMLLSACKMPLLLIAVTLTTALANHLIALSSGLLLEMKDTLRAILHAFAVAALLLAAVSPVFIFFAMTLPDPSDASARILYATLLTGHTSAVAVAGLFGILRLWRDLCCLAAGRRTLAARVMAAWLAIAGLAGSECSWILSPFLSHPDRPFVLLNPNAFKMNMYEYLWQMMQEARP